MDIRKPYTEIPGDDAFSGRVWDETYIGPFASKHSLPLNATTAYLTPALRNHDSALTPDRVIVGTPRDVYTRSLWLLNAVETGVITAFDLLVEILRNLILTRNSQAARLKSLLDGLAENKGSLPLSSEAIVSLIKSHLDLKGTSRLPVLLVAAAYISAEDKLGERVFALQAHNAADKQTGALGDVEITLADDTNVVTTYEMKDKRVTEQDLVLAVEKLSKAATKVDNYIFITTEQTPIQVIDYAKSLYEETGGTEFAILDCIGFVRHFLHLFHRIRIAFLDEYQNLILAQPHSAVRQSVKESFLAMREAQESN